MITSSQSPIIHNLNYIYIMTPQEQALQSWRDDKQNYEKNARKVINDLYESMQKLPSPSLQGKLEELKEYLRYNYTYDEEENFLEVYVHSIAGRKNISVMELANKLVDEIGGNNKFWQKKITDLATNVQYHPELVVWQVNSFYQRYLGLAPQATSHLRRKKSLAKKYLAYLSTICKLIDKSKPFEEDLVKIDEAFLKLKRAEEEYYAFVEEVQNKRINEVEGLSSKGVLNAKKNLFLFLKPKEPKLNTLINYNFKCRKSADIKPSKLMDRQQYAAFDSILDGLKNEKKSQRLYINTRQSASAEKPKRPTVEQLRKQLIQCRKRTQKQKSFPPSTGLPVYIWSKQFFYSYCGYLVKTTTDINYAQPFNKYPNVNYEIDSQQQYDEFYAQDVDLNDSDSSNSLDENQNSFVVSDYHQSDREDEIRLKALAQNYFQDRWAKREGELNEYTMFGLEIGPLPIDDDDLCCEEMIGKANGKSRVEIMSILEEQNKPVTKAKLQFFLKNNFKKMKSKDKKTIYVRLDNDSKSKQDQLSQNESTNENYEISISYASRPKRTDVGATILEESERKSSKSKSKSKNH